MIVRYHVHAHNIIIAYYETMLIHIMTLSILHVMNSTTVISILLDRKNPSLKKERERESKEIPLTERERERERKEIAMCIQDTLYSTPSTLYNKSL